MNTAASEPPSRLSAYQKVVVGMLAFLQFAVILDFMLMSPLGAMIMPALAIGPTQFGVVVSAYAFSAGIAGLLTAGFADRYDRKRLLLFFYSGFVGGTLWCGLANSFESLLAARIVTGLFGGVIGSVVLAIATDLFPPQMRGRVMGLLQTAFAASQVLGLPVGLYLSNRSDWHMPFLVMAGLGAIGGLVVAWRLQPVVEHLRAPQGRPKPSVPRGDEGQRQRNIPLKSPRGSTPWRHFADTVKEPRYLLAFAATGLLTTGGFMLMPFSSAFVVNNLGIGLHELPTVYLVTGICTIFLGPLIGKAADAVGKLRVFTAGTALSIVMVLIYTHLGPIPLPWLIAINTAMFVGIFSRMIPYQAMVSSVPTLAQRGSFNGISSSVQQLSGGIAAVVAGHIVTLGPQGRLQHFEVIGYVVIGTAVVAFWLVRQMMRGMSVEAADGARATAP